MLNHVIYIFFFFIKNIIMIFLEKLGHTNLKHKCIFLKKEIFVFIFFKKQKLVYLIPEKYLIYKFII